MLGNAIRALKLDRRLVTRRRWIDPAELDRALAELPDVAEKAAEPVPPPAPPAAQGDASGRGGEA
jgi:hypothetical protein